MFARKLRAGLDLKRTPKGKFCGLVSGEFRVYVLIFWGPCVCQKIASWFRPQKDLQWHVLRPYFARPRSSCLPEYCKVVKISKGPPIVITSTEKKNSNCKFCRLKTLVWGTRVCQKIASWFRSQKYPQWQVLQPHIARPGSSCLPENCELFTSQKDLQWQVLRPRFACLRSSWDDTVTSYFSDPLRHNSNAKADNWAESAGSVSVFKGALECRDDQTSSSTSPSLIIDTTYVKDSR